MSDPRDRKWYDEHRDAILRGRRPGKAGGDPGDDGDASVLETDGLMVYFSSSCFDGFDEGRSKEDNFY